MSSAHPPTRRVPGAFVPDQVSATEAAIEDACRRARALLVDNLSRHGILAASPDARAVARGYAAVFSRDAAVCAIGMALSGDARLESAAAAGLCTVAAHQAPNGQLPKFVDPERNDADFWYLGCIDATLWWLIGIDFLERVQHGSTLRRRFADPIRKAIAWLACQEHQRFHLVQQNEASDWADIMPRSGFVLYSNALWYLVKRLYRLPDAERTRQSANELFHPFSAAIAEYRRARLLAHYVRGRARNRDLYLSFVNFAQFGDEGDTFGNVLAVTCGLADDAARDRVLHALGRAGVDTPYPLRAVCNPIPEGSLLWRPYMSRHRQNYEWQYHNGGIWPFVGGFYVAALAQCGRNDEAGRALARLAQANALDNWGFREWLHGQTLAPGGMRGQSWNAAALLFAQHAVASRRALFPLPGRR